MGVERKRQTQKKDTWLSLETWATATNLMTSAFWFSTYYNFHITSNAPEEPAAAARHGTGIPRVPLSVPLCSPSACKMQTNVHMHCECCEKKAQWAQVQWKRQRKKEEKESGRQEGGARERGRWGGRAQGSRCANAMSFVVAPSRVGHLPLSPSCWGSLSFMAPLCQDNNMYEHQYVCMRCCVCIRDCI